MSKPILAFRYALLVDCVPHGLEFIEGIAVEIECLKFFHHLRLSSLGVNFLLLWWQNGHLSSHIVIKWQSIQFIIVKTQILCQLVLNLKHVKWTLPF